jgi:hypothetical protein
VGDKRNPEIKRFDGKEINELNQFSKHRERERKISKTCLQRYIFFD